MGTILFFTEKVSMYKLKQNNKKVSINLMKCIVVPLKQCRKKPHFVEFRF